MNSVGDIVFDDQANDNWYEAIDLTTSSVPEPSGILLLATGILALTIMQGANVTKASSTLVSADTCTFGWNYPKKDLRAARSFRISLFGAEVRAEVRAEVERAEVAGTLRTQ